jgi:hypothetical protein
MVAIVGAVAAGVLALLSALHVYWGAGGKTAFVAAIPTVGGKPQLHPGPLACFVVAALLATAALLVFAQSHAALLPRFVARWGTAGVGAVFLLRAVGDFRLIGFFKHVRGTRFAALDDRVYSPLCLALAAACFLVAFGSSDGA